MTTVVWFRRDLRIHDHPALVAALRSGEGAVPVFCLDPRLLQGRYRSGPRTQFLLECLSDLDASLRERGSRLLIRVGDPARELPALAQQVGAAYVHVSEDVGPFARRRDRRVWNALDRAGVALCSHPGLFTLDEPWALRTTEDRPYTTFAPYHRAWLRASRRAVIEAPSELAPIESSLSSEDLPSLHELGLEQEVSHPLQGGERAGRQMLARFLSRRVDDYDRHRDLPAKDATSRVSPYLHFGCVSPRQIEHGLPPGTGPAAFRRQLCWRDFYAQVLIHHPTNSRSEYQQRFRGRLRWSRSRQNFAAWREGQTGYPLVDAGMRQLRREGWMHNRARLVVGSFLTKDLGIDWRWGERWFMRLLLDGDEANNNGNWQWIASVGVDPEPATRRMFNPTRQQARFDPGGEYVRRYVPELANVPDAYLAEPWKMPADVQAQAGCVIGLDYPEPIVDHALARQVAIERYAIAS
jgi:deoxyribodipyrimidine photo-lyase